MNENDKTEMESFVSAWLSFRIGMPCAGDDIDALWSYCAERYSGAVNELKALAGDNNAQALAELGFIFMSTALLCRRKIRYRLSSIMVPGLSC